MSGTNSRFSKGYGVFVCCCCGKKTRKTTEINDQLEMCERCELSCYVENDAVNYGIGSAEHSDALQALNDYDKKHAHA